MSGKIRRSREGAWIEILCSSSSAKFASNGRSREGAWIEISKIFPVHALYSRRSREGAWIEI